LVSNSVFVIGRPLPRLGRTGRINFKVLTLKILLTFAAIIPGSHQQQARSDQIVHQRGTHCTQSTSRKPID
jgi:hypothetical protein